MPLVRLLLTLLFGFSNVVVFGQIPIHLFNEVSEDTYDPKDFSSNGKSIKQWVGVYVFGMSEGEWEFVILENNDSLIIQIWDGIWATNLYTKQQCFQRKCRTFNKVTVQENKIFFDNYSGLFAEFTEKSKTTSSLLLFATQFKEEIMGKIVRRLEVTYPA